jgi:hypothetical protein
MKIAFVFPPTWTPDSDGSLQIWNREVTTRLSSSHDVLVYSGIFDSDPPDSIIVRILAIAAFLRPAISTIGFVMISCGKTARYMAFGILDSIALVATVSVGVLWGARGVAIGHVAATYIVFLPFVWWALKGTPMELSLWLRSIARPLARSLVMVAVLYLSQAQIPLRNGFAAWSFSVVLGGICYFAGMLALPGGRVALSGLLQDLQSAVK